MKDARIVASMLAMLAFLAFSFQVRADDRDLLRESAGDPYVFVFLDNSGSMHWTPTCDAAAAANDIDPFDGTCTSRCSFPDATCERMCPDWGCIQFKKDDDGNVITPPVCERFGYRCQQPLCTTGDCFAPLNGDDPSSKWFQAKQALYEVISEVNNVNFGFANYQQNTLRVKAKHWLYRVSPTRSNGAAQQQFNLGGYQWPQLGSDEVFGLSQNEGWNCISGGTRIGCEYNNPADTNDTWELTRARRFPKLGRAATTPAGGQTSTIFVRHGGSRYRLQYQRNGGTVGDNDITVRIIGRRCFNSDCSSGSNLGTINVEYDLVSDFLAWDNGANRNARRQGYFNQGQTDISINTSSFNQFCSGWEPNNDTTNDRFQGYSMRWVTDTGRVPVGALTPSDHYIGDILPLDWRDRNAKEILGRLAPNKVSSLVSAGTPPDFRSATYMLDQPQNPTSNSTRHHRLKDAGRRPMMAFAATPIGASLTNFRNWYDSWSQTAALLDPDWDCRQKYIIFLTDGDESCGGTPCVVAGQLAGVGRNIRTYVVGFGLNSGTGNQLDCMASAGGTGAPIYPQNKDELVKALRDILGTIRSEARSFASASLPAIQNSSADQIFLSSFVPVPDESVWSGRLDAYRQPLPVDDDGQPDPTIKCGSGTESACHLWEAGAELLKLAPTPAQVQGPDPDLRIGPANTQRRVFYGAPYRGPGLRDDLRLLTFNSGLLDTTGLAPFVDANIAGLTDAEQIQNVIRQTLVVKQGTVINAETNVPETIEYIMGDVFHGNPATVEAPSEFGLFASDLCGRTSTTGDPDNCFEFSDPVALRVHGYRNYVRRQNWRRRMLITANNDGQLHFFDAGIRQEATDPTTGQQVSVYDDGTGQELFSYIPSLVLPILRQQANENQHVFSVDGELTVDDVYIDPALENDNGVPVPDEREWRTVVIGGLREGGNIFNSGRVPDFISGYYALDVTQPDELADPDPTFSRQDTPDVALPKPTGVRLPNCMDLDMTNGTQRAKAAADCGTLAGEQVPFPKELWTFADQFFLPDDPALPPTDPGSRNGTLYPLSEKDVLNNITGVLGSGDGPDPIPDLGDSWSRPIVGAIPICVGTNCDPSDPDNEIEARWVAVFGGGYDPPDEDDLSPVQVERGGWLYMVDIETGQAIYKRRLETNFGLPVDDPRKGMAPAAPAVLDEDDDGLLDVIYMGTTEGFMFKVDLRVRDADGDGTIDDVPALRDLIVEPGNLVGYGGTSLPAATPYFTPTVSRVCGDGTVTTINQACNDLWSPFPIFFTGDCPAGNCSTPSGRPIFIQPTLFQIPELEQYGLAFGVGDRFDLWSGNVPGRYYVVVDEDFTPARTSTLALLPNEDDYQTFAFDGGLVSQDTAVFDDLLLQLSETPLPPSGNLRGWVMTFPGGNRSTSQAFVISGILIFSVFEPETIEIMEDIDGDGIVDTICTRTGDSRFFVVDVSNGDPIAPLSDPTASDPTNLSGADRFQLFDDFTTAPFVSQFGTKNPENSGSSGSGPDVSPLQAAIRDAIKETFPKECSFNDAFTFQVETNESNTGIRTVATVPMAICNNDWRVLE